MANYCYFNGKLRGKEEEVREVYKYFSEEYNYNFIDFQKAIKEVNKLEEEIGLGSDNSFVNSSTKLFGFMEEILRLEMYPEASKEEILDFYDKYTEDKLAKTISVMSAFEKDFSGMDVSKLIASAPEILKGEVKKVKDKLDFERFMKIIEEHRTMGELPKGYHFWRIFEVEKISEDLEEKVELSLTFAGNCAWSLSSALTAQGYGKDWQKYKDRSWYKGISIEEVHEKFPTLKMEFFSEEPGFSFSEHILVTEDGIINETEDLPQECYDSVEEAEETGQSISEDMEDENFDIKLPSWYVLDEDKKGYSFKFTI